MEEFLHGLYAHALQRRGMGLFQLSQHIQSRGCDRAHDHARDRESVRTLSHTQSQPLFSSCPHSMCHSYSLSII